MSTISPLQPDDFPVYSLGQYVYRRSWSSPFVGPVSVELAADIAFRLNRDHQVQAGGPTVHTYVTVRKGEGA